MKHTKGPWEIKHEYNVFGGTRLVANCGGHSSNVDPEKVHQENKSNASLIAAAPELLEAVEEAIAEIEWFSDEFEKACSETGYEPEATWTEIDFTKNEVVVKLKNAIQKAKGE